mgnify:CR=1 FL=1
MCLGFGSIYDLTVLPAAQLPPPQGFNPNALRTPPLPPPLPPFTFCPLTPMLVSCSQCFNLAPPLPAPIPSLHFSVPILATPSPSPALPPPARSAPTCLSPTGARCRSCSTSGAGWSRWGMGWGGVCVCVWCGWVGGWVGGWLAREEELGRRDWGAQAVQGGTRPFHSPSPPFP